MKTCLAALSVAVVVPALSFAADWPQWRGPDRTGVSKETGLLQTWPKDGPKLLWTYKNAGVGFSSPSIVGDVLYTMGGFDDDEYVIAIDMKKQAELWRGKVGKLFQSGNWGDGPRSTPTVDGDRLYALGGHGDLVCLDLKGKEIWRKSFTKDLDGEMMSDWGYSESVLIDGDVLICTPGGDKGTLAALNKAKGDVIWRSTGLKNKAPYSSAMIHTVAGVKTYVQTSYISEDDGGVASGFNAKDGKPLWTQSLFQQHSYAIAPTPIIKDNLVYITSGYGGGCHLFDVSAAGGGLKAKEMYSKQKQKAVKNTHGGVVLIGDHIFGHSETQLWICQDLKTGEIAWTDRNKLSCRSGSIAAADNRLYLYTDDGETVLLVPNVKQWEEVGRFTIPEKSQLRATRPTLRAAAVWTPPVVANSRLYLRDQELIFCFDVSKK